MAVKQYNDETHIPVPRPEHVARARGIHAVTRVNASIRFRLSIRDQQLLEAEAEASKMGLVPFIRWCAVYTARSLRQERTGERYDVDP